MKNVSDFCSRVRKALRLAAVVSGGRFSDLVAVSQIKNKTTQVDDETLAILLPAFDLKPLEEHTAAELLMIPDGVGRSLETRDGEENRQESAYR